MAEQAVASVEVPLDRLEAQICEGAAHLAAGAGRWLLLVGEFDRRKAYERWECRSTAFWLNWQCGVSVRTAQDQVRVGRALLDYLDADAAHKVRYLETYDDEDGSVVGMFRLDPDEGAALRAALILGKEILRDQKRSAERSSGTAAPKQEVDDCSPEPIRPTVCNADALALMVETMLAADRTKDISRHERTLVVVDLDGDKAHLHDGPNLSPETARRLSCDACVCGVLMRDRETLDLGRTQLLPNRAQRRGLMVHDGGCRFPGRRVATAFALQRPRPRRPRRRRTRGRLRACGPWYVRRDPLL